MCFKYIHVRPCQHEEFLAFQPCELVGSDDTTHVEEYDVPVPPNAPCPVCGFTIAPNDGIDSWRLMEELGARIDRLQIDSVRQQRLASYNAYVEAQRRAGLWLYTPTAQHYHAHVMQNLVLRRKNINQQLLDEPQQFQGLGHYPYGGWQQDQDTGIFKFVTDIRSQAHGNISGGTSEPPAHERSGHRSSQTAGGKPSGVGAGQADEISAGSGEGAREEQDTRRALDPSATLFVPRGGQSDLH